MMHSLADLLRNIVLSTHIGEKMPKMEANLDHKHVGIVGAGSIGLAWAVVFSTAGFAVKLYDPDRNRLKKSNQEFSNRIIELKKYGLINRDLDSVLNLLSLEDDLERTVEGVVHVQECIPEIKEEKKKLFSQVSELIPEFVTIGSSTSFLPISSFASFVKNPERCLVIHPGNPPYLLRIAEIIPAPFTSQVAIEASVKLMESIDIIPVVLKKEIKGFVFNRLQGALLNEAYSLIKDGIISSEEIDLIIKDGLGLRWSIVGPFETVDLNTRGGIRKHAERMGPMYQQIGAERGTSTAWDEETIASVENERRAMLPLSMWEDRVLWRDRAIMLILSARKKIRKDR